MLLKILEPQIVVLSVAKRHLERIAFEPQDNGYASIVTRSPFPTPNNVDPDDLFARRWGTYSYTYG